eukprot:NODE_17_length_41373_cov_0.337016.p26 type:complete len:141 gc:universal NODE_17_length_41373_cov_0.337016:32758-32336(-)
MSIPCMIRGVYLKYQKYQPTTLEFVTPSNLHISSYDAAGFHLSNGIYHKGPIAIYQGMVLKWKATDFNTDNLVLWQSLKPSVLIFGTGNDTLFLPDEIKSNLMASKIPWEAMNTRHAVSTFSVLSSENRKVALLSMPCSK